jgi:hypothetical protein
MEACFNCGAPARALVGEQWMCLKCLIDYLGVKPCEQS